MKIFLNYFYRGLFLFFFFSTEGDFVAGPTLEPVIENTDPTEWTPIDTILYTIIVLLIITISALCFKICFGALLRWRKKKQKRQLIFICTKVLNQVFDIFLMSISPKYVL